MGIFNWNIGTPVENHGPDRLSPLRYLLLLVVVSTAAFLALKAVCGAVPRAEVPTLRALNHPTSIHVGERVTVYGCLRIPAGKCELGAYACEDDNCRRVLWRMIEGPQEHWDGLGTISFEDEALAAGEISIRIRVFDRPTPYAAVVATWAAPVELLPAAVRTAAP